MLGAIQRRHDSSVARSVTKSTALRTIIVSSDERRFRLWSCVRYRCESAICFIVPYAFSPPQAAVSCRWSLVPQAFLRKSVAPLFEAEITPLASVSKGLCANESPVHCITQRNIRQTHIRHKFFTAMFLHKVVNATRQIIHSKIAGYNGFFISSTHGWPLPLRPFGSRWDWSRQTPPCHGRAVANVR